MPEVRHAIEHHVIHTTSTPIDDRTRVLKHNELFGVFSRYGDMHRAGRSEQGLFYKGTRYLSRLILNIDGTLPVLLNSGVSQDNLLLNVQLTNRDLEQPDGSKIPQDTMHISRVAFLKDRLCYQRLNIANYGSDQVTLNLALAVDADFADIFEVRGETRQQHGSLNRLSHEGSLIQLSYAGLDGITRTTSIRSDPKFDAISGKTLLFNCQLAAGESREYILSIGCDVDDELHVDFDQAFECLQRETRNASQQKTLVTTSNEQFNSWLDRSRADIHMLTTQTPFGPYPYAGVPWFSTPFGRDGIITALEMLRIKPELARGVLAFLAANQADEVDAERDAQPGKILHEMRDGEMANLGEHPFRKYYGSVDVTPLFIVLAGAYYETTADMEFISEIWPNIEAALNWIDEYGDRDGDGFVEYARSGSDGLENQGWKDSHDSIFHADGSMAVGPIALCEVQGYVFAAKRAASHLAALLGFDDSAFQLRQQAEQLQQRFEATFWNEDLATYAIALDGDKQQCAVQTSNPGHCLFSGIASEHRARRIAATLMSDDLFSGWGVRTLAEHEVRYNPMSYHNGSVWPHDNAIIASGFARYDLKEPVLDILKGIFDASQFMDHHRLPELLCGFGREPGRGPTQYPVACLPQAWAAACVYMLLEACLGLEVDAARGQLRIEHPALPDYLESVTISNLRVGSAILDLRFHRHPDDIGVSILRRDGDVEIIVVK